MVRIAAKDQSQPELIDDVASNILSRSLNADASNSSIEATGVAFLGYVTWRSEENGDRNLYDEQVFLVRNGRVLPLPARADLANLSVEGLSWGSCGSASAQLALAMLMEVLNDWPRVRRIYHDFHTLVSNIPRAANWAADGSDIRAWALELERRLPE